MAITDHYVDPGGGNDTTGDGSIGTPWATVQKALDTITRDATNGNRINIKAGTADVLGAALTLATYGTPSAGAPLVIQGYTSAAGDGGIGEISGGGTYAIFLTVSNSYKGNIRWVDLKLGNTGGQVILGLGGAPTSYVVNCEFHTSSSATPLEINGSSYDIFVIGCLFSNSLTGNYSLRIDRGVVYGCRFVKTGGTSCIYNFGLVHIFNSVFDISTDTSLAAITTAGTSHCFVANNTIYSASANTSTAINFGSGFMFNNVIVGYSGAGGTAIASNDLGINGANAFYNCTTGQGAASKWRKDLAANLSLASDPYIDAANDDFKIDGDSDASETAWPSLFYGAVANAQDIGAVQAGAGAGGGGGPVVGSRIIRGLGAI